MANTYYARIHLARFTDSGAVEPGSEVDVDARPSDAINLAVRFGSPMYVSQRIADAAATTLTDPAVTSGSLGTSGETASEIVRSVREAIASFEDPTGARTGTGGREGSLHARAGHARARHARRPELRDRAAAVPLIAGTRVPYPPAAVMFRLQQDLAVKEERFEDAHNMKQAIVHEMTHNQMLRVGGPIHVAPHSPGEV